MGPEAFVKRVHLRMIDRNGCEPIQTFSGTTGHVSGMFSSDLCRGPNCAQTTKWDTPYDSSGAWSYSSDRNRRASAMCAVLTICNFTIRMTVENSPSGIVEPCVLGTETGTAFGFPGGGYPPALVHP